MRAVRLAVLVGFVLTSGSLAAINGKPQTSARVLVELLENIPAGKELSAESSLRTEAYNEPAFAFVRTPTKYSPHALALDRSTPFVLRASLTRTLPPGEYDFRLRARNAAWLLIDGKVVAATDPQKPNKESHDPMPEPALVDILGIRPLHYPHQQKVARFSIDEKPHTYELVAVIGGKGLTPFPGELSVSYGKPGQIPRLLGGNSAPLLTDAAWESYSEKSFRSHVHGDIVRRRNLSRDVAAAWNERHQLVRAWMKERSPQDLTKSSAPGDTVVDRLLAVKQKAAGIVANPVISDLAFLRRVSLDTIGMIPTADEVRAYLADPPNQRRYRAIERLLNHPGWADHWVSYWQDVLAENPGILKPDLNNTGPFRWWLHQSFRDDIPLDRMVTELIEMEGSAVQGAPAAFAQATLNDSPMAAKATIISQAFLGQNMACARCHDAPNHPFSQKDLYSLAAMLSGKPIGIPETSTVKLVDGFRTPNIKISLKAGEKIEPAWPFVDLVKPSEPLRTASLSPNALPEIPLFGYEAPTTTRVATRRQLAALVVSPENERFAQVMVNRVWKRYMGRGLVEPADDWSSAKSEHPELLQYLSRELLRGGYSLKHLARLILHSRAYRRKPVIDDKAAAQFAGPTRRRMTAEQLVDSLHRGVGKQLGSEDLNLSPVGDRPLEQFLNLGTPCRAWEFTAISNERDRPSLALPMAQSIVDVLTTFGWRQSRQNPVTVREDQPSPMQTLILANGIMGTRITRLSDDSAFTELCLQERPLPEIVRETFLRILSRQPNEKESKLIQDHLRPAFGNRRIPGAAKGTGKLRPDPRVSWANHFSPESTHIRMQEERRLRTGDEPTKRLTKAFRERFEDVLWSLVNSPEFVVVP